MKKFLMIFLVISLCFFSLSGCREKGSIEEAINDSISNQEVDYELAESNDTVATQIIMREKVTYEIVDKSKKEVTLNVTAPNLYKVLEEIYLNESKFIFTQISDIEGLVLQTLKNGDFEYVTKTVTVAYRSGEDGYELEMTDEYADAIHGGVLSFFKDYIMGDSAE